MGNRVILSKVIRIILFILFLSTPVWAATKLIDYGFEDWTGNADTTSGYLVSSSESGYWTIHKNVTEVFETGDCVDRAAHTGSYFWHQNYSTATSSCGSITGSAQGYNNIGYNAFYPSGSGDSTDLETDIDSNTGVVRFYFRTVGNWKTQVKTGGGNMGYLKFIRFWSTGGAADSAAAHLHLRVRDNTNTTFFLADESGADFWGTQYTAGVDLIDGNWHSVVFKVVRNNDTQATGNVTKTVWFDDWDMTGDGTSRTVTEATFSNHFEKVSITGNWSATFPSTFMGIDIDDIEVWDGLPTAGSASPNNTGGSVGRDSP